MYHCSGLPANYIKSQHYCTESLNILKRTKTLLSFVFLKFPDISGCKIPLLENSCFINVILGSAGNYMLFLRTLAPYMKGNILGTLTTGTFWSTRS
jgi:hypothetical protein